MFALWFKALRDAATAAVSSWLVNPGLGDSNSAVRAKRGFCWYSPGRPRLSQKGVTHSGANICRDWI